MATKAPTQALIKGLRVLRYLQGTKDVGLHCKACQDHDKVRAYGDANFGTERSQTGSVIKLGSNVITWRSSKQPAGSINTTESEVQAVASTEQLGEYVKALRESTCKPRPDVELGCDNTSAIVLSIGEGSWRTKSLANKVYYVREEVELDLLKTTITAPTTSAVIH